MSGHFWLVMKASRRWPDLLRCLFKLKSPAQVGLGGSGRLQSPRFDSGFCVWQVKILWSLPALILHTHTHTRRGYKLYVYLKGAS